MQKMLMLAVSIAIVLPMLISAECQCTASGDPHWIMCDKQTRFDYQAEGLFTAFKSEDLEVQVFQTMAKDKPVAYVDYCSIKFVKDDCNFVMKTRSIKEPNSIVINGEKMPVTNGAGYLEKNVDKKFGISFDANNDVVFKTNDGVVHVICKPQQMVIRAPTTKKCSGLCGDCSGKTQQKPTKPIQHACSEMHQSSGNCKPKPATPKPTTHPTTKPTAAPTTKPTTAPVKYATPAPTTPAPTTTAVTPAPTTPAPSTPTPTTTAATPAPTTTAATPEPTTPAPTTNATTAPTPEPTTPTPTTNATTAPTPEPTTNATTAPTPAPTANTTNSSLIPPPVKEADKSKIPGHPVFESEEVMKQVINACMCGQPKQRMDDDKVFGGFVESCIYDKSLGPNEEETAANNMETYLKVITPMPTVIINEENITVVQAPIEPQTTVVGNITYTNVNFDTSAIREKHVTKAPLEIPAHVGVSYKLRYSIPDDDVALVPELMPRAHCFTGTGQRSEPITPTPAQQMAMTQMGMRSSPAQIAPPVSAPQTSYVSAQTPAPQASYLAPPNGAMPPRGPMGSSRSDDNAKDRFPFSDGFPSNGKDNDDNKLKVHFDLEAPVIVSAK